MNDYAFGVIPVYRKDGKDMFLLIKCRSGHWGFPKGHPKQGETETGTALRELEEETGIKKVKLFEEVSFTENYVTVVDGETLHKMSKFFLGKVETMDTDVQDHEEIGGIAWEYFDQAFVKITHASSKQILLDVEKHLQQNPF
jgi:bis(5'-nucleosidyl)-tetraphosphatase